MKIGCDVIEDLIPLYIDEVCSEESHKLVEEHIRRCDKCRKKIEIMKNPMKYPKITEEGESIEPFKKIKKRVRIHLIMAVLITASLMGGAMFAIQEIGSLHDYFYPVSEIVIDNPTDQKEWKQVQIGESEFLNFTSIFYNKELVNDANSDGSIVVRILDGSKNVVIEETMVKAGESVSLKKLENGTDYILEVKSKEGRYFLNLT